jgi:hypothetical protein
MRMAPLVRSAVALLSLSLVGSCSPEIKDSPTQIMVRVDSSNSQLKASFSELRVSLARREGDHWEQGSQQTLSSKIIKGRWPIDLPVVPRSPGDDFKQFQVVLDLMKGGKLLAQNRAVTTFLPNERKMLELWIEACPGHDAGFVCAESDCEGAACEVCNPADGECIAVGVTDPKKLSALTDDAVATDRDAGPVGRTKTRVRPVTHARLNPERTPTSRATNRTLATEARRVTRTERCAARGQARRSDRSASLERGPTLSRAQRTRSATAPIPMLPRV